MKTRIDQFLPETQVAFEQVVRNLPSWHRNSGQCVCASCLDLREKIEAQIVSFFKRNIKTNE